MVLINTLWALSLVIALITASLGILVKQWLHELLSFETHDPKERLKLRFFREVGLERWKVFALASSLPLLRRVQCLPSWAEPYCGMGYNWCYDRLARCLCLHNIRTGIFISMPI